jgi:heme exporter protein A
MRLHLDIDAACCRRGGRVLFRALSFGLESGAMLSVAGPNGVGKTSLLRQIAGFLPLAAGSIRISLDGAAATDPEDRARLIGWLGIEDGLKGQMRVGETLAFFADLYGGDKADPARFGLAAMADWPVYRLSAGQKRRLALARLAAGGRPLWLMDEPTALIDAPGRRLLADLIAQHCAGGGIVVAASHDPLPGRTLRLEPTP